ncbi:DcrB-related protein [Luteipulveratus sp. YIM 133132]|uniref:DcrB-related protein n=1 Tax=Luteipulveratus flavus TaxID=3031728 RepID=UPI0023AEE82E|nr:DcrB-related protein [Luteipulveratus sp. YIM 133132]MDE9365823.1 DcrB-related protein [Luteipulveratus sp. YIM 133132]
MKARRSVVALLPVALLAAGCSSPKGVDPSSVPPQLPTTVEAPSATHLETRAAPGALPASDRSFGVLAPAGWANDTTKHPTTVLYLRAPQPSANVYPCFSVVKSVLKDPPALEELVNQGMIAQRQKGATVTKLADRTVGGAPASGYAISRVAQGYDVAQTQYYILNGSQVVVTTMTSAAKDKATATTTQESILTSWSWGTPSSAAPTPAPSTTP